MTRRWSEGEKYLGGFEAQSRSIRFPKSPCSPLVRVGYSICSSQGQMAPAHRGQSALMPFVVELCDSTTVFLFFLAWMSSLVLLSSSGFTLAPGSTIDPLRSSIVPIFILALAVLVPICIDILYSIILYLTSHPNGAISGSCIWHVVTYYSRLGG